MNNEFGEWLKDRIKSSGKTQKEFAQIIGLEQPQLSRIITGQRGTSDEVLNSIASVLGDPPEMVFRKAGKLPHRSLPTEQKEELAYLFDQLSDKEKEFYLNFLRATLETNKKKD